MDPLSLFHMRLRVVDLSPKFLVVFFFLSSVLQRCTTNEIHDL
jgi:hypothetical protein